MTGEADVVIQAAHAAFDELAGVVEGLGAEHLTGPSAASEWTIADVLSHLGSGAVIGLATLDAALAGEKPPGGNQAIWDRWNALEPQQQADESLMANRALLARYDSIDAATREALSVDMGFLPQPVPLAVFVRFRLSELTLHSWDVRAGLDPSATLNAAAVPLLFAHTEFMLGWIAQAGNLPGRTISVETSDPAMTFGISIADSVSIGGSPVSPDAVLALPAEAWLRLVSGRLKPVYTPEVQITGSVTLDELRSVFPGY